MWIFWSICLGVGLAMDAFAVSVSNGLKDEKLKISKMLLIATFFGVFQGVMPMIGYFAANLLTSFSWFKYAIPIIGFSILMALGMKSIYSAIKKDNDDDFGDNLTIKVLIIQAIATSIDALMVGIGIDNTISATASYQVYICFAIIAVVTFGISLLGCQLGKIFKDLFSTKAEIIGGIILIAIAIKIIISFIVTL